MQSNRKGFRGYIRARMEMGRSTPQHIQQMVMREYCKKNNMEYLLAATEYLMPGCTMILDGALDELDHMEGIVMYSIYLLPSSHTKRMKIYQRLFEKGCSLHAAVENIAIRTMQDAKRVEECWLVHEVMLGQTDSDMEALKHYATN